MPPAKETMSGWSRSFSSSRISEARTWAMRSAKRSLHAGARGAFRGQGVIGVSIGWADGEGLESRSIRGVCGDRTRRTLAAHDLVSPRSGGGYLRGQGGGAGHLVAVIARPYPAVTGQW